MLPTARYPSVHYVHVLRSLKDGKRYIRKQMSHYFSASKT